MHSLFIKFNFIARSSLDLVLDVEKRCAKSKRQKFSNIKKNKLKTHEAILNFEALLLVGSGVSSLIDLVLDVQK